MPCKSAVFFTDLQKWLQREVVCALHSGVLNVTPFRINNLERFSSQYLSVWKG